MSSKPFLFLQCCRHQAHHHHHYHRQHYCCHQHHFIYISTIIIQFLNPITNINIITSAMSVPSERSILQSSSWEFPSKLELLYLLNYYHHQVHHYPISVTIIIFIKFIIIIIIIIITIIIAVITINIIQIYWAGIISIGASAFNGLFWSACAGGMMQIFVTCFRKNYQIAVFT